MNVLKLKVNNWTYIFIYIYTYIYIRDVPKLRHQLRPKPMLKFAETLDSASYSYFWVINICTCRIVNNKWKFWKNQKLLTLFWITYHFLFYLIINILKLRILSMSYTANYIKLLKLRLRQTSFGRSFGKILASVHP